MCYCECSYVIIHQFIRNPIILYPHCNLFEPSSLDDWFIIQSSELETSMLKILTNILSMFCISFVDDTSWWQITKTIIMLWHCQSWCIASTKFWWMAFRHFHPEHFLHSCYLCRFEPIEDIILHFVCLQNFCPILNQLFQDQNTKWLCNLEYQWVACFSDCIDQSEFICSHEIVN